MSKEATKAFVERMKTDDAFREKVLGVEDVDARIVLIAAEGFDCSAEEIGALQELADLDLEGVIGGGSIPPPYCQQKDCPCNIVPVGHRG